MIPDTRTAVAATVSMEEFAKRVGFRLEDLALNRAGKVSSHQLSESYRQATVLAGAALVSLGMAVVICLGKLNSIQSIIPGVIVAAVGIISAVFCLKVLGATWAPKVASSEGNIELTHSPGSATKIVVVGSYNWTLDRVRSVPTVLVPGVRYRVFYLAGSDMFLSIEPLS